MEKLRKSWVGSANSSSTDFPLNNLPYGIFSEVGGEKRCCVAIGDKVLDLSVLEANGILNFNGTLGVDAWNAFMNLGQAEWARLRGELAKLLAAGSTMEASLERHLHSQSDVILHMPIQVSEFTDFYSCANHASNVGTMLRGAENALPPNWYHIPIGYNGRASSVVISGTDIKRPFGQIKGAEFENPSFAPTRRFDIELEMGAIVGRASEGPISVETAHENIFGYVLLNDWSSRDFQAWEYQPLGPFQAKATATTISPWIVTALALEPFRIAAPKRVKKLLPYLEDSSEMHYDISLQIQLETESGAKECVSETNFSEMYFSSAQQLAHHTSSGCPMRVGDLLGSGTISGAEKSSRGSFLEMSWGGKEPLILANGQQRSFLEDGDTVTLTGAALGDGFKIGFGDCVGRVVAAG